METLAGFQKTGRVTRGPAADLVELVDDDGFPHTAIAFHPQYRDHPAIGAALEVVKGFLEAPYVTGMVELVAHEPGNGTFVYPTGESWAVHEVIRKLADLGQTAGVRAGLELLYAAGQVLIEAAESGESHAVYSHGGLTPWRVLLKADGQVQIIGHAVPQVEILQFHADPDEIPKEDAFRYCPPERLEAEDEDLTSDLFSLALIAFELMTGRPVYDGLVNDIRTQAARGEGSRRLFRFKDQLPSAALDLMRTCLKPDPEHRHSDGDEFLETVQKVLASPEAVGPSLMDIMDQVGGMQRPPGEGLEAGKTMALDRNALRKLTADVDDDDAPPQSAARESFKPAAARRPRRARRARRPESEEELAPAAPVAEPTPPPRSSSPEDSDERWKAPDRGRREGATRRSAREESPAVEPSKVDRSGADEILKKLKSSSDKPSRRRTRSESGEGNAARLIENILSSSEDVRSTNRSQRAAPSPEPEEELLASQSRKRPTRSRRAVRRRRDGEDQEAPAPTAAPKAERRPNRARSAPKPEPAPVDVEPSASPEPEPPADKSSPARPRRAKPAAEKPKAARAAKPEPTPSPEPAPDTARVPSGPAPSAPRRLKATGGASIALKLHIAPDGDTFKTRFPGKATLAECVARLTASLLPIQTDLAGRLTQAWRLGPKKGPLAGDTLVETLKEGSLLHLHPIVARETITEVRVDDADAPHRFRAPLSNLAPAATVVDHLVRWLDLPAGDWTLYAGDRALGPFEILDEVDLVSVALVLKR